MTTYTDEINVYNPEAINGDIESARTAHVSITDTINQRVDKIFQSLSTISSSYTEYDQTEESFTFMRFNEVIDRVSGDVTQLTEYMKVEGDALILGSDEHPVVTQVTSTGMTFYPTISPHPEWAAATVYAVGDKVIHDVSFYECTQAHTASASLEPGTAGGEDYWEQVPATREPDYENPIASFTVVDGEGILEIHRAVVVNEMRLGDWTWMPRVNGNLSLKWIGA